MRRLVPALAAALVALGALAGCTANGGGSSAGASAGGASSTEFQAGTGRMPAAGTSAQTAADRAVVRTGSLQLIAKDPIAVAGRVQALVEGAGGRVGSATEDPSGRPSARLRLRIPAADFDRVLARIEQQGDVRDVTVDATDVTAQVTDYDVRIASLRTSIARLQTLLKTATDSDALVKIESALTDRQTSLEQLLGQQRTLADQVSYATLTVAVVTPAAAPARGPGDFLAGVTAGARGLVAVVAALLVGFGVALPWLGVLAAAAAVSLLVRRALRRRARPTSA